MVQLHQGADGRWTGGDEDAPTDPADPLVLRINSALYTANVLANVTAIGNRIDAAGAKTVVLDCSRARSA